MLITLHHLGSKLELVGYRTRVWLSDQDKWSDWSLATKEFNVEYPHLQIQDVPVYAFLSAEPTPEQSAEAVHKQNLRLQTGDIVAFEKHEAAILWDVIGISEFRIEVREHNRPTLSTRWADKSSITRHWPRVADLT